MDECFDSLFIPILWRIHMSETASHRAGLDFVHRELIRSFYCSGFLLLLCHVSDRLSRPHASKHIIREEKSLQEEGEVILFKDCEGT